LAGPLCEEHDAFIGLAQPKRGVIKRPVSSEKWLCRADPPRICDDSPLDPLASLAEQAVREGVFEETWLLMARPIEARLKLQTLAGPLGYHNTRLGQTSLGIEPWCARLARTPSRNTMRQEGRQ
jgi:hypothetical protein